MPSPRTKKTKSTSKKQQSKITYAKLRKYNFLAAGLHAVQGVLILVLSNPEKGIQAITTNYLAEDKLSSEVAGQPVLATASHHLFDLNIAYVVAAFFFISAIAHLIIATWKRKQYEGDLKKGINRARWIQYAFLASTMMVGIALLGGIFDFTSLLMVFALTAIMSLLGLTMELRNQGVKKIDWSNYWLGRFAGLVPWLVLVIYLWNTNVYGNGISGYVYWIYGSLFILFSSFAVNEYLQYKKHGHWADYLYVERTYIILTFIATTVLAWQIFAGMLS